MNLPPLKPLGAAPHVTLSRQSGLPFLPPIGVSIDSAPSPHQEFLNPGSFKPQTQQHVRATVDQTITVSMSSAAVTNSNGQFQQKDMNPGQQGVSVESSGGLGLAKTSAGQFQRKDLSPIDQGMKVSAGPTMPVNVSPADQNVSKPTRTFAPWAPPAVTVDAGVRRPGGGAVPADVMVR